MTTTPPDDTATTWRDLADQVTAPSEDADAVFQSIVANLGAQPRCEVINAPDMGLCGRLARYHVVCHDCGRGLTCGPHLRAFLGQVTGEGSSAECNRCGRLFARIEEAVTVVEL
ncbi:hypothetical protein [Mycobacterium paragordonae]|uniref:hypothetical protein n=1 Tax=Mycobacterium paragordonae TaxID=1389713 RepID=UPI0012E1B049|nr:hypothetical protein [Mycobacterium paragordonae]